MEPLKRVAIHIVTWNSARFLPDLFQSIREQTSKDATVTVVDNASTDGTLEWLKDHEPDVLVLKNFRNQGFARGHNQAIALTRTRSEEMQAIQDNYMLVLNPDIVLHPDCIREIISYMDAHTDVDMAGPKLLRSKRVAIDDGTHTERTNIIDSTGLVFHRNRRFTDRGAGEEDTGSYDELPPFGISGAAMVLRARAIKGLMIGDEVFDEDFFSYKEDVDLSWRLRLQGGRAALIPKAVAWHDRGAKPDQRGGLFAPFRAQRRHSAFINFLSSRNQRWLEWKNDDAKNRLVHALWIYPSAIGRLILSPFLPGSSRAMVEAWMGWRNMKAKRRLLLARRHVTSIQMREWIQ